MLTLTGSTEVKADELKTDEVKVEDVHCDPITPNLPPGSYQLSCYSCIVRDDILSARCLTIKGWPNVTSARISTCPDHYFCNNDGILECSHC